MHLEESSKSAVGERSERSLSVLSTIGMPSFTFGGFGVALILSDVNGVEAGGLLPRDARSLTETELWDLPVVVLRRGLLGVRGVSGTSINGRVCTPVELNVA